MAESPASALDRLGRDGLLPIRVELVVPSAFRRGPSRAELSYLFRSLAGLVSAGLPVSKAVASAALLVRGELRLALKQVGEGLHRGASLSDALARAGVLLPPAAKGILVAAESGSQLERGLGQVAEGLEREAEIRGRLGQALAYPLLLVAVGLLSSGLIIGVVIPKFAALLADMGQEPPAATRLMLGVSHVLGRYGAAIGAAAVATVALFLTWFRTPAGRLSFDRIILRAPLAGPLVHQLASGRVAGALGATVSAGVPLLASLGASGAAAGNREIEERMARVRARVSEGQPLGVSLDRERALTGDVVRLASLGEANGRLGEMLVRGGELALVEAERRVKGLMALIEPLLIVCLAVGVGLVAAALLQAVYSLRPGVDG